MLYGKKPIGTIAYLGGVMALPEPFVWSWTQMIEYNATYLVEPNQSIHYTRSKASYHSFARNILSQQFFGDWILMLDTDHQFEPDIAARMLYKMNKYNLDVLVGIYQYKSPPYSPVLYKWNKKGNALEMIGKWDKNAELFEIGSAGGGCLMIKRSVFQRIKKELKQEPFDIKFPFSEDHSFFYRLKKLGITPYCDPSIQLPHLTYKAIDLNDFDTKGMKFSKRYVVQGLK